MVGQIHLYVESIELLASVQDASQRKLFQMFRVLGGRFTLKIVFGAQITQQFLELAL